MPKKSDKIFVTQDGSDTRKATKLNLTKIKNYFTKLGYKVKSVSQLWRHVHGVIEKNNREYFFKMASTPGISERTKNEASWNKALFPIINKKRTNFLVPQIFKTGEFQGLYYYISEYYQITTK